MTSVHQRFDQWLRDTGQTTVGLGHRLRVDPSTISHLRAGRRTPSLRVANQIERLSAIWVHGPIRAMEWTEPVQSTEAA